MKPLSLIRHDSKVLSSAGTPATRNKGQGNGKEIGIPQNKMLCFSMG